MKHPAHKLRREVPISTWTHTRKLIKAGRSLSFQLSLNTPPSPLIQPRAPGPSNAEWNSCLITVLVWTRHSLSPPLSNAAPKRLMSGNNIHRVVCQTLIYHTAQVQRKVEAPRGCCIWRREARRCLISCISCHTWLACCPAVSIGTMAFQYVSIPGSVCCPLTRSPLGRFALPPSRCRAFQSPSVSPALSESP